MLLVVLGVLALSVLGLLFFVLLRKPAPTDLAIANDATLADAVAAAGDEGARRGVRPQARRAAAGGLGRMNLRNRRTPQAAEQDASASDGSGSDSDGGRGAAGGGGGGGGGGDDSDDARPTKRMGKKKAEKMQRKEEARAFREQEERAREQRRQEQEEDDEKRDEERKREKAEIERLEREDEARRLERQRQEEEQYREWRSMMETADAGTAADEQNARDERRRLFAEHVRARKVVVLDDVASEFNIKTREAVADLQAMDESGQLRGIIDDRGKFIYITETEMDALASFVKSKGRVSISQVAAESNKLIVLNSAANAADVAPTA